MESREQRRDYLLADILRTHVQMVMGHRTLDETLAHLARGAAQLAETSPDMVLIRVVDPVTRGRKQDVHGARVQSVSTGSRPFQAILPDPKSPSQVYRSQLVQRHVRIGITGRAIDTGKMQIVDDVKDHPDYVAARPNVRSEIALPLMAQGQCWGVLNLESRTPAHFKPDLVPLLEIIASEALLTIQGDLMRAQLEQDHVALGYWMSTDRLRVTLNAAAWEALRQLPGRFASVEVLVLTRESDALVSLAFASDNPQHNVPGRFARDTTIAWQAVRESRPVHYPNLVEGNPKPSLTDSRSALALPFFSEQGAVIGVFNVEASQPSMLTGVDALLELHRRQAEEELRLATRESSTLLAAVMTEISNEVTALIDPQDLVTPYQLVLRQAIELIGRTDLKAALAFLEGNQLSIHPDHTFNYPFGRIDSIAWPITRGITGRAVRARQSQLVHIVSEDPDFFPSWPDTACELAVPLLRDGRVLGVIDLISPVPGALTVAHLHLVEALAAQVVHALERAEQIRQGQVAVERISLIRHTNERIENMLAATTPDELRAIREQLLRDLVEAAMNHARADFGGIIAAVRLPEGPSRSDAAVETELVLTTPVLPEGRAVHRRHWPSNRGVTGRAYREKRTLAIEDVTAANSEFQPYFTREAKSELAVPILSDDQVLGILNLESTEPRTFSREQIGWVELFASQAANVLSAAHLHLVRAQQRQLLDLQSEVMLERLYDGGRMISPELQRHILQAALDLTEHHDGYASLWLADRGTLRRASYLPQGGAERQTRDDAQAGIVRAVFELGVPILALNVREPRWRSVVRRNWPHVRSELAVPLIDLPEGPDRSARLLGVLNVESAHYLEFSHDDIEILQLLARTTVSAVRNLDIRRARFAVLRDLTHAVSKTTYPLQVSVHELKHSPFDPAQGGFDLEKYEEKASEVVALSGMVNSLFDWFQQLVVYENGDVTAMMESVPLADLVLNLVERMHPFALDAHGRLVTDMPSRLPTVTCVPDLIKAALFLLIQNALSYGTRGEDVIVRVRQVLNWGRVEVINRGRLVPEQERDRLFEPGFRGSTANSPGSGIGLDQVRRIVVRMHGGLVGYDPQAFGNLFFIQLPLKGRERLSRAVSKRAK